MSAEPVAWVIRAPNGHIRMWQVSEALARKYADEWGLPVEPMFAQPSSEERSEATLSADGQQKMIEDLQAELERVKGELAEAQQAMKWVDQVYPSSRDGGAWVSMTWDEFNAMRAACSLRPVRGSGEKLGPARANINLMLRLALEAAEARATQAEQERDTWKITAARMVEEPDVVAAALARAQADEQALASLRSEVVDLVTDAREIVDVLGAEFMEKTGDGGEVHFDLNRRFDALLSKLSDTFLMGEEKGSGDRQTINGPQCGAAPLAQADQGGET